MDNEDSNQAMTLPDEIRGRVTSGGPSGFLNYMCWVSLVNGATDITTEFTISEASAVAVRGIYVEAFMDIGTGGYPESVPAAELTAKQFNVAAANPTIPLPLTKTGTVPNNMVPRPPDVFYHYRGTLETYFHLPANGKISINFKRNSNTVRNSYLKVVFTVETW